MSVEEISAFEFVCVPFIAGPIRSCTMIVYAKDRDEADKIFFTYSHEFFNHDIKLVVRELGRGYRQSDKT